MEDDDLIERLPNELGTGIFYFLDIASLGKALLVCHHWHALASSPFLWAPFYSCLVVIAKDNNKMYKFSPEGELLLELQCKEAAFGSGLTFHKGWIYGGTRTAGYFCSRLVPGVISRVNLFTGKIQQCASLPSKRSWYILIEVDGKLLAFGAFGADEPVIEEYDPATDHWVRLQESMPKQWKGMATKAGRDIFFISVLGEMMRYNLDSKEWQDLEKSPTTDPHSCCFFDGTIYVKSRDQMFGYDISTNQWRKLASYDTQTFYGRVYGGLFVWQDTLMGCRAQGVLKHCPDTDEWKEVFTFGSLGAITRLIGTIDAISPLPYNP